MIRLPIKSRTTAICQDPSFNIVLKFLPSVVLTEIRSKKTGKRQIVSRYEGRVYRTVGGLEGKGKSKRAAIVASFRRCSAGVFLVMVNGLVFVVGQTVTQR